MAGTLGSTRVMTDSTGSVCFDAEYYPYGREKDIVNNCPQNFKFTGKERDPETGLDNFGARYYASSYTRFMSPDPGHAGASLANPESWNAYTYTLDNPETLTDPTGTFALLNLTSNPEENMFWSVWAAENGSIGNGCCSAMMELFYEELAAAAAAAQKQNNTPAKFVVENNKTVNRGSYSIFTYQLENSSGSALKGTYGVKERLWSDRAAQHHAQIAKNSEKKFVTIRGGEAHDIVGYDPGGPGAVSFNVYQTFAVRQRIFLFLYKHYNLHTEFEHETVVNDGNYNNVVIDVVP